MSDDKKITAPRAAATAQGQSYISNTVIIAVRSAISNKQVFIYYLTS